MRLEEGRHMCDQVIAMLEITEQLRTIGEDIKDNRTVALLLCSLPETYTALIKALETRPEQELTLEYVKGKLIYEYDRRKENTHHDDKALKMYKDTKQNKESGACFCYKRTGHLKKDCSI